MNDIIIFKVTRSREKVIGTRKKKNSVSGIGLVPIHRIYQNSLRPDMGTGELFLKSLKDSWYNIYEDLMLLRLKH